MSIDQKTAYAVSDPGLDDYVCFWRERRYDQLECLKARYNKHEYAPHTHDTYVFGVILSGAESFTYRGVHHIAGSGRLVAMEPDEVHDGKPLDESYAYRCFYPSVALVREVAGGLSDRSTSAVPRIAEAVMDDPALAERLARLHWMMEYHAPRLAVDTAFTESMALFLQRHANLDGPSRPIGRESGPIRRVRDYIDAHAAEDMTLDELAAIAGFSRFHLARAFRKELGLTPFAYLTGRRIARAKRLLAGERPLSQVALDCGFYDQSHLSRSFKAWVGVTPGRYRLGSNSVQDDDA